jgi:PAS domain S-box-containing protein
VTTEQSTTTLPAGLETYFRTLCETLGVALIATDSELRIRVWNAAATRMFGAAADRMIGTPVESIIPQDSRETALSMLRDAIQFGDASQFDFDHRDVQGVHRELAATIAPVVSETGERLGASLCFRDITRRIELAQRLENSKKMAALGEMAGAVAHHFNNILGGIITRLDYAKAKGTPQELQRMVEPVGGALVRAMGLVNGLLTFSEGDRRTDDIADLNTIMRDVADEAATAVAARGIEFTLSMPKLPVAPMARAVVVTVLRNIVQNAIEAMPNGGTLRIDVTVEAGTAVIRVTDSGVGLSAAARARLFEPFWTTKGVLAEGTGHATGMGLAVAHGLTQMIGGSIAVDSQPAQGSCFTVRIPISDGS